MMIIINNYYFICTMIFCTNLLTNQNKSVRMGAHHTLTSELHQNFSIEKDCWEQIYLEILEED